MNESNHLVGRIALVTGAASGIGAATAERLAAEGAIVYAADLNLAGVTAVAERIGAYPVALDVSDADAWTDVVKGIVADRGAIDIAYLNAGIMTRPASVNMLDDPTPYLTLEGYERIRGVNLDGVAFGVIALLPHMAGRGGDLLMTASVAGLVPFVDDPYYGLTKHGVVGFGRSLAAPLARHGIRVNVICPGGVDSGILAPDQRASRTNWSPPSYIAELVVDVIRGRESGNVWVAYREDVHPWKYEFAAVKERIVATQATPVLLARDVSGALERYAKIGFETTLYGNGEYGFLRYGQAELHVSPAADLDPKCSDVMAYLYVRNADDTYAAWKSAGVDGIFHAPTDTPYGLREGAYVDPDGNLIRFGSPLPRLANRSTKFHVG